MKGGVTSRHNLKWRGARGALANFLAAGVLALGDKLGPLLWQLPARLHFGRDRVAEFLELLPRDTVSAARLAREHDERIEQPYLEVDANHRIRHVLEPRHESFFTPEAIGILRSARVALAV